MSLGKIYLDLPNGPGHNFACSLLFNIFVERERKKNYFSIGLSGVYCAIIYPRIRGLGRKSHFLKTAKL